MTLAMRNTIAQDFTAWAGELIPHEMRSGSRLRVHMPVHITYEGLLNKVSRDGICTDINETGIGFKTHAGLYVGEIVELEFRQQDTVPFRFRVRLLYKMGHRYGAAFVSSGY
jgi:hypothetical protein